MTTRPIRNKSQFFTAYNRWLSGESQRKITNTVSVTERTVQTWVNLFKEIPEEEKANDKPFHWAKMDNYGIPWTDSQAVVSLVRRYAMERNMEPTGRHAKWIWRLVQFNRFADIETGREQLLYRFAERFITHELEALFNQPTTESLENLSMEAELLATRGGR